MVLIVISIFAQITLTGMKKLITLFLLLALPLSAYCQQRINRNVAGLTLGRYYSVERLYDIIWDKFSRPSHISKESSSTSLMALESLPFAGEKWDCLNVTQEASGRVSEILFGKVFKEKDELLSFAKRVAEMLISKYGPPTKQGEGELVLEWVWNDTRNTKLSLQAVGKNDSDEPDITLWLSYSDELLMKKIQSDTMNEL